MMRLLEQAFALFAEEDPPSLLSPKEKRRLNIIAFDGLSRAKPVRRKFADIKEILRLLHVS